MTFVPGALYMVKTGNIAQAVSLEGRTFIKDLSYLITLEDEAHVVAVARLRDLLENGLLKKKWSDIGLITTDWLVLSNQGLVWIEDTCLVLL